MSTVKISELPVLSSADAADEFVVVDDSAGVTKKITQAGLADFGSNTLTAAGITFGSDTLDDYEFGTWTPTLATTGTNFSSVTYNSQTFGTYIRIGKTVFVHFRVRTDAVTVGSASGDVVVGGLPYSGNASLLTQGAVHINVVAGWAGDHPFSGQVVDGENRLRLQYRTSSNSGSLALVVADVGTGSSANLAQGTGFYEVT